MPPRSRRLRRKNPGLAVQSAGTEQSPFRLMVCANVHLLSSMTTAPRRQQMRKKSLRKTRIGKTPILIAPPRTNSSANPKKAPGTTSPANVNFLRIQSTMTPGCHRLRTLTFHLSTALSCHPSRNPTKKTRNLSSSKIGKPLRSR